MRRDLKTRSGGRKASPRSSDFQILSLSGGGYRGLFTAVVLEECERRSGRPLRESFDLIAGTSIGGIIACGLAAGIPAATIRREFESRGAAIFERRIRVPGLFSIRVPRLGMVGAKYSRSGLEAAIDSVLGDAASVSVADIGKPLLVPSVSATNGTTVLFDSTSPSLVQRATLKQVALATSAAPTYFPEFNLGDGSLVDGGIVANAPDAIAVFRAMSAFGHHPSEIKVLSIGTAGEATGEVHRPGRSSGVLKWMVARNLFGLTLGAQQSLALDMVRELLADNFLRIDILADKDRAKAIALDKAGAAATSTLKGLAQEAMEETGRTRGADLAAMLRHVCAEA
jgi:predicted acylesterase/phospholipase RssA